MSANPTEDVQRLVNILAVESNDLRARNVQLTEAAMTAQDHLYRAMAKFGTKDAELSDLQDAYDALRNALK